jgi:hypothetical protein
MQGGLEMTKPESGESPDPSPVSFHMSPEQEEIYKAALLKTTPEQQAISIDTQAKHDSALRAQIFYDWMTDEQRYKALQDAVTRKDEHVGALLYFGLSDEERRTAIKDYVEYRDAAESEAEYREAEEREAEADSGRQASTGIPASDSSESDSDYKG